MTRGSAKFSGASVPGAIFLFGLAVRLAFVVWHGPTVAPDTIGYLNLARNMVERGVFSAQTLPPFTPSIRRAPLYPAFLAFFEWSGSLVPTAVVSVQALMDASVALGVFLLASAIVPRKWAVGAAITYAVHPGATYNASAILSETFFTALLMASALSLAFGFYKSRPVLVTMGGIWLGLATLCRPIALLLPLTILALLPFAPSIRYRPLLAILFVGSFALVVAPWVIRSSLLAHRLVPVQAWGAVNFYISTRVDWDQKDEELVFGSLKRDPLGQRMAAAEEATPQEVAEVDRAAWQQAYRNIVANPPSYLASRAMRVPGLVLTSFDVLTGFNESFRSVIARRDIKRLSIKLGLLGVLSFVPFILGVISLPWILRHPVAWVSAAFWIYTIIVHIPLWIESRFWWPVVPFLLVSAALGAERLGSFRRRLLVSVMPA